MSTLHPWSIRTRGPPRCASRVARANKSSRFYQLKDGALAASPASISIGPRDARTPRAGSTVPIQDPDLRASLQELPAVEDPTEDPLGHRPGGDRKATGPRPEEGPHQDRELLADEWCSRRSLNFSCRKNGRPTGGDLFTPHSQ